MLWRGVLALLVVALAVGILAGGAEAQSPSCTSWVNVCHLYSLWAGPACVPYSPGTLFDCQWQGSLTMVCRLVTSQCPPAAGADETCPTCGTGKPAAGAPISLATGNTYIEQTDLRVPGLGGGLTLVRTWNSRWPTTQSAFQVGLFGPNWRSNFEERVFVGADHYTKYARGDGSFWSFGLSASNTMRPAAPANVAATLTWDANYWTLTFQNGEKRIFSYTSGSLVAIVDRNGNTTQLSYDAINRLTAVTDPAGRQLYFGYPSETSFLVTSVTSNFGVSLSYAYDGQGRLVQITNPDQSTLHFEYDSNSLITAVKDSQGKVLESHIYDGNRRGLTSSRANGVEAVTITYPNQ